MGEISIEELKKNFEQKLIVDGYNKEYLTHEEMKKVCKTYQKDIVEIMLAGYEKTITDGKSAHSKKESSTLYIPCGQNASGKSGLMQELSRQGITTNAVPIIIDDMKSYHPLRDIIDKNYPEHSEELLHIACFEVFDKLLEKLLASGYDVLIERTLGSKEKADKFINIAKVYGCKIEVHAMGTHGINSLLSALERFIIECRQKDNYQEKSSWYRVEPRPIAIEHHDNTYENIIGVLRDIEGDGVNITVWDRTPGRPTPIYSTEDRRYPNATVAMKEARRRDFERCIDPTSEINVEERIRIIEEILNNLNPDKDPTLEHYYKETQFIRKIFG